MLDTTSPHEHSAPGAAVIDADTRGMRPRIDPAALRVMMRVDARASLAAIAFDWGTIATAIAFAERVSHPLAYLAAVVVIGARQHGLGVMMHEGAHLGLHKRRPLNDLIGELLAAWPLFISMRGYRAHHNEHHRHLNSERDPDFRYRTEEDGSPRDEFQFPMPPGRLALLLIKDLIGLGLARMLGTLRRIVASEGGEKTTRERSPSDRALDRTRLVFYAALVTILTVTGGWRGFALYWLVPLFTWMSMVTRLRGIAEHWGISGRVGTRTTLVSWLEGFLLAPHNIGFHADHHMFPAVRFYALPELHRVLAGRGVFSAKGRLRRTHGYLGVFRECTRSGER